MLEHEIDMARSGEEVSGLLVNSFELVGDLEDLDCSADGGADSGKRIWMKPHTGVSARRGNNVCVRKMIWRGMEIWTGWI